jgi:hypothetical protein
LPSACPGCGQAASFSRPCWRCKRTFIPENDVSITCERCQPYLSNWHYRLLRNPQE